MIWLLRHAEAEDGSPDSDRKLTKKGKRQAKNAGLALKALGVKPEAISMARTAAYREPYVDHGRIGRILLLQPDQVDPWHSGVETVLASSAFKHSPKRRRQR